MLPVESVSLFSLDKNGSLFISSNSRVCDFLSAFFLMVFKYFLGAMNITIDNSVSHAIRVSGKICLTKKIILPEKNIQTTIGATKFENSYCEKYYLYLA